MATLEILARASMNEIDLFVTSRRLHTRYWRDWSSDVCSSDLIVPSPESRDYWKRGRYDQTLRPCTRSRMRPRPGRTSPGTCQGFMGCRPVGPVSQDRRDARSEERRVGKEGRSRWSPYH